MSWKGWSLFQINIYFLSADPKLLCPGGGGRRRGAGLRGAHLPVYARSELHPAMVRTTCPALAAARWEGKENGPSQSSPKLFKLSMRYVHRSAIS